MSTLETASNSTEQLATPIVMPVAEIDPRLVETIDYIDPVKLAKILAMAEQE
jgi:hypothetical protein